MDFIALLHFFKKQWYVFGKVVTAVTRPRNLSNIKEKWCYHQHQKAVVTPHKTTFALGGIEMLKDKNIHRFETELKKVNRPGMDKLLEYIRKSDFYSAPASTRYHLSCKGGLLQHSLNVLDALRGLMVWDGQEGNWRYSCSGEVVCRIKDESVTIMALLHDLCKTHYYKTSTRNVKNEQTGKWEKAPFYTVEDKMPLGHGSKSAMLQRQYLTPTAAFPAILDNAIEKAYVAGHKQVPVTFDKWTKKGTLPDFKTHDNNYLAGPIGDFEEVPEGGELKNDRPTDAKLPTRKLKTYGKQFTLTRQAFINDDIGLVTSLPARHAAAARRTINRQCYEILMKNPKIYDDKVLFSADHKNLLKTGTGITKEALPFPAGYQRHGR